MTGVSILGSGIYLPERRVSNAFLEERRDLPEGFIKRKTGMEERRWSDRKNREESVGEMALVAASAALEDAEVGSVDAIIVARDAILTRRAHSIGLEVKNGLSAFHGIHTSGAFCLDIANYCPSFVYGLNIAQLMIKAGQADSAIVVGSTDYTDLVELDRDFNRRFRKGFNPRARVVQQYSIAKGKGEFQAPALNAFLWGSGAGAVVVGKTEKDRIIGFDAEGSQKELYDVYGVGESNSGKAFASLDGQAIKRFASIEVPDFITKFMLNYLPLDRIQLVPHQPQPIMLDMLYRSINMPVPFSMHLTCDTLGNMIGASIPVTYHIARKEGRIKPRDNVIFCGFGDSYLQVNCLAFEER